MRAEIGVTTTPRSSGATGASGAASAGVAASGAPPGSEQAVTATSSSTRRRSRVVDDLGHHRPEAGLSSSPPSGRTLLNEGTSRLYAALVSPSARAIGGCLVVLVAAAAAVASAAPRPEDAARAAELAREAQALIGAQNFAEACPKLEESYRLDPGSATLLELALCHEGAGRSAAAWGELTETLALARREGHRDRVVVIQAKLRELEPRLFFLTLVLAPDAEVPGLVIARDGEAVAGIKLGVPVPLDPGRHDVVARAPERVTWQRSLSAVAGASERIVVPALQPSRAPSPAEPQRPSSPARTRRIIALITGGAALALLGVGLY